MNDPLLRIVVYGTPGTAGSKSAFPIYRGSGADREFVRTVVTEKPSAVKRNWRQAVVAAAQDAIACRCDDRACVATLPPYPLDEPLVMSIVFTVAKPVSAPKTRRVWPMARPDLLKYTRATEDALTDAGVLKDDARIVEYTRLAKVFPRDDPDALDVPGAVIRIWRMGDLAGWQRDAVAAQPADTLFGSWAYGGL